MPSESRVKPKMSNERLRIGREGSSHHRMAKQTTPTGRFT